jgi:DNA repair protein RecO (recombination protein O)
MARFCDQALILRRFRFGETSLVTQVATRSHGRVHLLAKGAYRPSSRFYAVLDLFDTLELEWIASPGRELATLQAASLSVRRHRLALDLARFRAALTMLELADLGCHDGPANHELFTLTCAGLDRLLAEPHADRTLVEFELGFLHNLGLTPALVECASCGGAAPAGGTQGARRAAFSAQSGGRLCAGCAGAARALGKRVGTLPETVLLDAARLAESAMNLIDPHTQKQHSPQAGLDPRALLLVRDVVARFLEHQLQGRPKSYRQFLSGPQRNLAR